MSSDAALLAEIAKLKGAISQHKTKQENPLPTRGYPSRGRFATRGAYRGSYRPPYTAPRPAPVEQKEVEIGGVTYVTDGKKLTRKDVLDRPATKPASTAGSGAPSSSIGSDYVSLNLDGGDVKKSKLAQGDLTAKRTRLNNLTLILNNAQTQRYRRRQPSTAKAAKAKKQCPFFTRTGICTRGRTCPYQHDPEKVAICPKFLKGDCPNGDGCPLSHEPTPQRMPFCVHFANAGRCKNGDSCIYPHVHLGANVGVCRDFAVLGYCEKGADCDKKHVRECPDFAETGVCKNRRCKLPHVIRAKHAAKAKQAEKLSVDPESAGKPVSTGKRKADPDEDMDEPHDAKKQKVDGDANASFADEPEFIPLTFEESEEEEEPAEESAQEESVEEENPDDGEEEEDGEDDLVVNA